MTMFIRKPDVRSVTVALCIGAFFLLVFIVTYKINLKTQQHVRAPTVELKGLVAVDVEPYFKDPRVQKTLEEKNLRVTVTRVGSRGNMAKKVKEEQNWDFCFSSGVVAANQIVDTARELKLSPTQSALFHTPLVIASWDRVAKILVANGVATPIAPKTYSVNMGALTELMLAHKRWKDLKGSAYDANSPVLVYTTHPRSSASAGLYLALTSAVFNKGDIVTDRTQAKEVALKLTELFKRQGYMESYVDQLFLAYAGMGDNRAPLAFLYEYQMANHALTKVAFDADMVLMYPQPTIVNQWVFVAISDRAKELMELLSSDSKLQGVAVEYGFRTADVNRFVETVKSTGLAFEPRVSHLINTPSIEIMNEMLDTVTVELLK
ncbi:MAG: hypothetical protein KF778_07665 [Rhodocyclaceae bacterium]|nr:hypothetical protein [Rhodocyclaceae bacterium]MBX3668267.1 hypothetical protein [Rhodocyclaceae bacterium]